MTLKGSLKGKVIQPFLNFVSKPGFLIGPALTGGSIFPFYIELEIP